MLSTKKILTTYLHRLTNLAGNNRQIFLPRLPANQYLDLHTLSQLNGEKSFSIIEALINQKKKFICPLSDARMEAANEASKKLKQIQRADQFTWEERGAKDLYVGWPIVEGKFKNGTLVRCPLLFIPAQLQIEQNKWFIQLRPEVDISFNKSFVLAYAFYNQVAADEALLEESFENAETDTTVFRTALYQLLQKSSIDLHFNPDNYRDELVSFDSVISGEFDEAHFNGSLKLFPKAVLGIFPQAGSFLVPDYLRLLEQNEFKDLEEFFSQRNNNTSRETNFTRLIKEDKVYPIFSMDEWQENALKAVKAGRSVVVHGPPGTGKSQLICNLVSDAIANGMRTLVVCQKRAALDVVFQRLTREGLSDFLALIHDFRNDRKDIFEKISRQIERIDEYKTKNISLDSIQLERAFVQASRRIDQVTDELEEFRSALFDEKECGRSIKELYLSSNPKEPFINMRQEYQAFHFRESTDDFLRTLKAYCTYATAFTEPGYCWFDRKSFAQWTVADLADIQQAVKEVPSFFSGVSQELQKAFNTGLDWDQWVEILQHEQEAREMLDYLQSELVFQFFKAMLPESDEKTNALWLSNTERVVMDCFHDVGPESTVPSSQLGQLQEALHRSVKARRGLIGWVRWELFSKDKFLIRRVLVANGLENNRKGFMALERKLDFRLNLEHNITKLKAKPWLTDIPEEINPVNFKNWFARTKAAMRAKTIFSSLRGFKSIVNPAFQTYEGFTKKINNLFTILSEVPARQQQWLTYLTPTQIRQLTLQHEFAAVLLDELRINFDSLHEFDKIKETLPSEMQFLLHKLHDEAQTWEPQKITALFINSLNIAWIDHIEIKYPILRMVSSGKISQLEAELKEQSISKQKISAEILLLRARERVIDDLEFNRLNNRITYRDLFHQVTKKKKIWPVRKLVAEYESEVFKLMPCWLASPESVSALFPMKQQFDLVIFDEASQCYAEQGIPSLYRGKQVVIAGDNKQLRPGDFYLARWEGDEDSEHPDLELDSLLELGQRHMSTVPLRSHYRSHAPELIHFSNQHFYDGELRSLPHFGAAKKAAIEFIKVDGKWENNTNKAEAEAIADYLLKFISTNKGKSAGIITFNAPQQALILDAIESRFSQEHKEIPQDVFVKNIENVQGDERDVIIFSIGYAADASGKVKAMFGSLNNNGGENRLNVAITRAKENIVIFSSILPEQLKVDETRNEGPKLLKHYLQFALDVSSGSPLKPLVQKRKKAATWYLRNQIMKWSESAGDLMKAEENIFPHYDLTLYKSELAKAILMTDDENYAESLSAKAFHYTLPQLAEKNEWVLRRIYSRSYWQDQEKFFLEISKLVN